MLRPLIEEAKVKATGRLLETAQRIVITCHVAPDGDAVGSSLGLMHTLRAIGKEVHIVTPDRIPDSLLFLPGAKEIVPYSKYTDFGGRLLSEADLIFCLDFNTPYRVDRMADVLRSATAPKVLIDHHEGPEEFATVTISHPDQSSTCALLFRLLCRLELFPLIDRNAAMCIYTGMMTDTGNFSYNSNDPELYLIIAELLRKGIDKDRLYKQVMDTKPLNVIRLHAHALERMQVFPEAGAALITLSADELKQYKYKRGDTEGLVNQPLSSREIFYSVFLREDPEEIKVSVRSKGSFRVNDICARHFNGGGHVNASGGELKCTLEEAVERVKLTLPEAIKYKNSNSNR